MSEQKKYVRVKSVRRRSAEPVYNMEVERFHNFAVNGGLIVHNCIDATRYALETQIGKKKLQSMSKGLLGL